MSGWGSPKSAAAGSPKSAVDVNVGGRSPRAVGNREQDRTSRRLGLTHSLTSPRTPEPKPELPTRPQLPVTDDLPRPRSLSPPPRRTLAQPSVTGSVLSAKLERASFVRASNAPAAPVAPPPPKTRARFSSRRGELDDIGANVGAAADAAVADYDDNGDVGAGFGAEVPAPTPSGDLEEPMTPTPTNGGRGGGGAGGDSGSRVAALALAIESRRQEQEQRPQNDETPVMTLPAVITAAEAANLAAETRMRDSRNQHQYQRPEQFVREEEEEEEEDSVAAFSAATATTNAPAVGVGMGVKRVGRVRGRAVVETQQEEESLGSRSVASSSDYGMAGSAAAAAAGVYGTDNKSQIQASPQYWVPKKLGRSPVNKNKSAPFSPAAPSPSPSTRPRW